MSNEIQVRASVQVRNGNLFYQSQPTGFNADQALPIGPTPGSILATLAGTDVNLSALTTPGMCVLQNYDPTNFVTYGIFDGTSFHLLGELLPGELYVLRLSRHLGESVPGPGTGTITPSPVNKLRIRADTAPCEVLVAAFNV